MTVEQRVQILEKAVINLTLENTSLKDDLDVEVKRSERNWRWFTEKDEEFKTLKKELKEFKQPIEKELKAKELKEND